MPRFALYNQAMDTTPFKQRRQQLLQRMGAGIAIIPTADEKVRNRDTTFPFRPDSYFHYLTGFPEPEAVLVLIGGDAPTSILFCREKNEEREIWDGFRHGPGAAAEVFGFDQALPIAEFDAKLPELLANQPTLWYTLGADEAWDKRVIAALNAVRGMARAGKRPPAAIRDVRQELDNQRLVKDANELALMRRAADISAAAHRRAMSASQPGRHEYEIEAELLHEFRRAGSEAPAYTSIVASGANACILHYIANDQPLRDGELLLIDAGCEIEGYAADITRTFPVSGRFSSPQADVYNLVLDAQNAAIAAIKPGAHFMEPHEAAVRILAQGLVDMKLLHGSVDAVIEEESYKRFYMHRTSHWLGRDVHDAGEYKDGEHWKKLEPGMVLTVEPGCYIRPADDVPEDFWNIGVRIEDDAVVTTEGCDIITIGAPKTVADIEALMKEARK